MAFNVVGRAVDAGVVRAADRWTASERVINDPAYEGQLEQLIGQARTRRISASAKRPDSEHEFDHLFPPATREEAWRRADAAASVNGSSIDEDAYRALFGED